MENLYLFRKSLGISQESMAKTIGVTFSYYVKVERGSARAAAGFIRKFLNAFSTASADMFFTDDKRV